MDFPLKIFKSLNCQRCTLPFSKNVNDRNEPWKFPTCGLTVCTQCFKNIKSLKQRQFSKTNRKYIPPSLRQSQELQVESHCSADPSHNDICRFDDVKPAYFFIELLNNPAIVESPNGNGYYLTKQFDIPECVICQEEYSLETEDRKPCDLKCNHTICFGCVKKTDRLKSITFGGQYSTFILPCPVCTAASVTFYPSILWRTNSLIEFLKELPEMTKQLEKINEQKGIQQLESRKVDTGETTTTVSPTIEITDHFDCPECVRMFPIEDMFWCSDCSKKICGSCVTRRHREHKLSDLFAEETSRLSEETKQMVSIQIDGYKRILPELHQQLVERIAAFENVLGEKVEGIAKLESLEKTKNEFDACKDYGDRFERISEDFLPNLRSFDTNLQNLIDELKEGKISETKTGTEKK